VRRPSQLRRPICTGRPAPPPDVRRGSAPPLVSQKEVGFAPGSGFAPKVHRPEAGTRAEPNFFSKGRRGKAAPHIRRQSRGTNYD